MTRQNMKPVFSDMQRIIIIIASYFNDSCAWIVDEKAGSPVAGQDSNLEWNHNCMRVR